MGAILLNVDRRDSAESMGICPRMHARGGLQRVSWDWLGTSLCGGRKDWEMRLRPRPLSWRKALSLVWRGRWLTQPGIRYTSRTQAAHDRPEGRAGACSRIDQRNPLRDANRRSVRGDRPTLSPHPCSSLRAPHRGRRRPFDGRARRTRRCVPVRHRRRAPLIDDRQCAVATQA